MYGIGLKYIEKVPTSCPCPIDTFLQFKFFRLASASMEAVGSDPIDNKHTMGVDGSLSLHIVSRFRITPSANFSPIELEMYLRAWSETTYIMVKFSG